MKRLLLFNLSKADSSVLIYGTLIFFLIYFVLYKIRAKSFYNSLSTVVLFFSLYFFILYGPAIAPDIHLGTEKVYNEGMGEYLDIESMFYPKRLVNNYPIWFLSICIFLSWLLKGIFHIKKTGEEIESEAIK